MKKDAGLLYGVNDSGMKEENERSADRSEQDVERVNG